MTSSNGNIFRVTGPLWGKFTGHWWSSLTKVSDAELWCFLWSVSEHTVEQTINTGDLIGNRTHYDVTVMAMSKFCRHAIISCTVESVVSSAPCRPFQLQYFGLYLHVLLFLVYCDVAILCFLYNSCVFLLIYLNKKQSHMCHGIYSFFNILEITFS